MDYKFLDDLNQRLDNILITILKRKYSNNNFPIDDFMLIDFIIGKDLYEFAPNLKVTYKLDSEAEDFFLKSIEQDYIPEYTFSPKILKKLMNLEYDRFSSFFTNIYSENESDYLNSFSDALYKLWKENRNFIMDYIITYSYNLDAADNNKSSNLYKFIVSILGKRGFLRSSLFPKYVDILESVIGEFSFEKLIEYYSYFGSNATINNEHVIISKKARQVGMNLVEYEIKKRCARKDAISNISNIVHFVYLSKFINNFDKDTAKYLIYNIPNLLDHFIFDFNYLRNKPYIIDWCLTIIKELDYDLRINQYLTSLTGKVNSGVMGVLLKHREYIETKIGIKNIIYLIGTPNIVNKKLYKIALINNGKIRSDDLKALLSLSYMKEYRDLANDIFTDDITFDNNDAYDIIYKAFRRPDTMKFAIKLFKNICKARTCIPFFITKYYDIKIAQNSTFNMCPKKYYIENCEYFTKDLSLSNEMLQLLINNIIKELSIGTKVSFNLLFTIYLEHPYSFSEEQFSYFLNPNLIVILDKPTVDNFYRFFFLKEFDKVIVEKIIPAINENILINSPLFFQNLKTSDHILKLIIDRINCIYEENSAIRIDSSIFNLLKIALNTGNSTIINSANFLISKVYANIELKNLGQIFSLDNFNIVHDFINSKFIPNYDLECLITINDFINPILDSEEYTTTLVARIKSNAKNDDVENLFKKIITEKTMKNLELRNCIINIVKNSSLIIDESFLRHLLLDEHLFSEIIKKDFMNVLFETNPDCFHVFLKLLKTKDISVNIYSEELIENIIKSYSVKYKIPVINTKLLLKYYGSDAIVYLEDEKIIFLLREQELVLKKLLNIFKKRDLTYTEVCFINESFRQSLFGLEHKEVLLTFSSLMAKIQNGISKDEKNYYINLLLPYVNDYILPELSTSDDLLLSLFNTDKFAFLNYLIDSIETDDQYSNMLNIITRNYIVDKRNKYIRSADIFSDTTIMKNYSVKSMMDKLFNFLLSHEFNYLCNLYQLSGHANSINVLKRLKDEKSNIVLTDACDLKTYKNDIIRVKKEFYQLYEEKGLQFVWINITSDESFLAKVNYKVEIKTKNPSLKDILEKVDLDIIIENIINNDDVYCELMYLIEKYKFLDWLDVFNPILNKLVFNQYDMDLYNFINHFYQIRTHFKIKNAFSDLKKEFSPSMIIKYTLLYDSGKNFYNIILGQENAHLLKENPGPNAACDVNSNKRLDKAVELQLYTLHFNEITIPSFQKIYNISKKGIRVIIGNRIDPRNLTHGERTGSCMRIGGIANSLFELCYKDKRGFHIVFESPGTGEYISRVSGFRNGNTIFLNELRHSVLPEYSDNDLILVLTLVAEELIELSKDSYMPIENVVCSPKEAFGDSHRKCKKLSEYNISKGIFTGYRDVTNPALVLASTRKNNLPCKLKLSPENQPTYDCVRLPLFFYEKDDITVDTLMAIERIKSLRLCLENCEDPYFYKTLDVDAASYSKKWEYMIIGQDFFIGIDSNLNVFEDYIYKNNKNIDEIEFSHKKILQKLTLLTSEKEKGRLL